MDKPFTAIRGLSSVVAEALLVLIIVGAAVLLYAWLSGSVPTSNVKQVIGSMRIDAVVTNATGIYVWLHGVSGEVVVSNGYLFSPDGSLVAVLYPVAPRYVVQAGEVVVAHYVPSKSIDPGTYLLRVPGSGDDASATIVVSERIGQGTVFRGIVLNSTGIIASTGTDEYSIKLVLNETSTSGLYRLYVYVEPNPGYKLYKVSGTVYNASFLPPRYVGQYYIFVDDYSSNPVTSPNYISEYWEPLYTGEQPYYVAVIVDARPS